MLRTKWLLIICTILTSACRSPDIRPTINIPLQWPHGPQITINEQVDLPDFLWWKTFHSTELNKLIETALHQNNHLNIAIAKIDYAQSRLQEVKLNWLPGMSILTGYSQFPVLGNPGAMVIAAPAYILNIFQQYKEQKSAQALVQASQYAKEGVRLIIIAQVSSRFFTVIAQLEAIKIYNSLLENYTINLRLAQTKYQSGLIAQDDLDELNSEINQVQSQITRLKNDIVINKNELHFLLNENPGELVLHTSFKKTNINPVIPSQLPVTVLNNRPDIQQAKTLLKAANADVGAVAAQLLPSITLGAYLGNGTSIPGAINLSEYYLNIPAVNLPVFAQIKAEKVRVKALWIQYVDTIKGALRDVDNDLATYQAQTAQLHDIQAAYQHEKQHCHWVNARYKHGIEDNLNVVHCQIKLAQLHLRLNQSRLEKVLVLARLYQDLGGGYCEH